MPMLKKIAASLLTIVGALIPLSAVGAYLYARQGLPVANGRLVTSGLEAPVQVIRDSWDIPHIYAQDENDLFFAQGYVQAQDRLWQMEVLRRAARGTLSELLGARALTSDRLARTLGLAREAEREWEALDAEARQPLEAYARGVNAYLSAAGRRLPPEFLLLGYAPGPWQPADSMAIGRLMAWELSGDWRSELVRARLVRAVGPEQAAELEGPGAEALNVPGELTDLSVFDQPLLLEEPGQEWPWFASAEASDSGWVVGSSRSATGQPLLASAPNLPAQMPAPWYEMHLVGGRYDVIGATLPGLPCVVIGRNRSLAWGITSGFGDVEDLVVERTRPGEPLQVQYDGQWERVSVIDEEIRVRGQTEPVPLRIYLTRHGPLVTTPGGEREEQVALRWAGAGQPTAFTRCLAALNRAGNWDEFKAALKDWTVPVEALTYADVQGNIGCILAGRVPYGTHSDGRLPVPGWSSDYEWQGMRSSDALGARLLNPPANLIIAANTRLAFTGDLDLLTRGWPAPYRVKRIRQLLESRDKLTVEDMEAVQGDLQGPPQPLLEQLLAQPPGNWMEERTLPYLRAWDLRYDAESAGAGVFETYCWRLAHNTLDDELGPGLVDAYLNANPNYRAVLEALSQRADNPWFDDRRTPERETRDDIIQRSFAEAVDALGRRFGDLAYEWNWGRVHNVTFKHALGSRWPENLLFNRGAMRAGGAPICVDATGSDYGARMAVQGVPYRLVIDLAPGGQTLALGSTGQSGHPLSAHFADMLRPWREGRYHPLLYEREAILQAQKGVLTLTP